MLSAEIAVLQPQGLASVAICNSPASMELWMAGCAELVAALPPDIQDALTRHEEAGTVTDPEYLAATDEFYRRHLCRVVPMPQDLVDTIEQMEAEPTVYHTMNGPNEFHVLGTLRGWTIIDRLPQITAPTLVIAGEFDEATPEAWQPYVDQIADAREPRLPRHQPLLASRETRRGPRRRRRVPGPPRRNSPRLTPLDPTGQPWKASAASNPSATSRNYTARSPPSTW